MPRKKTNPRRRRFRGTGSVFADKRRGGYRLKIPAGRDEKGRLKYRWRHAKDADEAARLMTESAPPAPGITLADWSARWLASLDVREQSRDNYAAYFRLRILPALGAMPVSAVTPFHVEEAARRWGESVGATTVRHTLAALSACLQAAARAELVPRNPARLARKPKPEDAPRDPFSPAELRRIVLAALRDRRHHPFAVCAATGCRIGEALGLRAGDYDAATGRLSIRRTMTQKRGAGPPKSRHGTRTLTVPALARPALAALPFDTDRHRTMHSRWAVFLAALGLRYRGVHQLRHSVATHAIAAGSPIANVARDLGDSVATVVKTYLHPTPGAGVCEAMEGVLGAPEVAPKRKTPGKRGK